MGDESNLWRSVRSVRGDGGKGHPLASALRVHVSYLRGSTATAVVRAATIEDSRSIARLVIRDGSLEKGQRQERSREMLTALRDRRMIVHVVELQGRICGAVRLRLARKSRIFASEVVISEAGRAFDPALMLRMMAHAIQCCHADGWTHVRYLADLPSPWVVCGYFRRLGYQCSVDKAEIRLGDRLRFGRRSHELHFTFPQQEREPDISDPRIVWF